jgi:hypothetical protein
MTLLPAARQIASHNISFYIKSTGVITSSWDMEMLHSLAKLIKLVKLQGVSIFCQEVMTYLLNIFRSLAPYIASLSLIIWLNGLTLIA